MLSIICLYLILFVCSGISTQDYCNPFEPPYPTSNGVGFILTESGLNEVIISNIPYFSQYLSLIVIEDVIDSTTLLGMPFNYSLTDISIKSFSLAPISMINFDEPNQQVDITFSELSIEITFNWEYDQGVFPYISDNGWGEASLSHCAMSAVLSSVEDFECMVPYVTIDELMFDIGDIDITLHGGASWLYDLVIELLIDIFSDVFVEQLTPLLQEALQDAFNGQITGWVPVYESPVDAYTELDMRVPQQVPIYDTFIDLPLSGQVYDKKATGGVFWQQPLPLPTLKTDLDFSASLDRMVPNSAAAVGWGRGLLIGEVVGEELEDEEEQLLLSAEVLGEFIPGLDEYGSTVFDLSVNATAPPLATVQPVALYLETPLTVDLKDLNASNDSLVSFDVVLGSICQPNWTIIDITVVVYTLVYMDCSFYNVSAAVSSSDVCDPLDIDAEGLLPLFGVLGDALSAEYSSRMEQYFPIPLPDIGLFADADTMEATMGDTSFTISGNFRTLSE
eukprot:gnl/Dysnectes_brevis/802_a884_2578.p1 GENE.gnl/Dysnectes_brevis/802_a884_2578~~gnl/Dysnectes_brevis/802_a884_2578.p1  ORF type:complete len:544 (+),score=133.08 gnl/Dysnectes_brevis/802_a884_2578:115-1632(+)